MKHLKLLLAVLLAALLLTGCGTPASGSVSGTVSESTAETESTTGNVKPGDQPSDVSGTVSPTETETPAVLETEAPADNAEDEFGIGTQTGGVYENSFLHIGCELDENWTFASEDELLELAGIIADGLNDEDLSETLRSSNTFYDLYAFADDGLVSINIVLEKLGVINGTILNEDSYADLSMDSLGDTMTALGVYDAEITKKVIHFAGADHTAIRVSGTIEDTEIGLYETVVCIKQGGYMACVTLCSAMEDITDTLISYFYAV